MTFSSSTYELPIAPQPEVGLHVDLSIHDEIFVLLQLALELMHTVIVTLSLLYLLCHVWRTLSYFSLYCILCVLSQSLWVYVFTPVYERHCLIMFIHHLWFFRVFMFTLLQRWLSLMRSGYDIDDPYIAERSTVSC